MIIKVREKCLLDTKEEAYGLRVYSYKSNKTNLIDAILDIHDNFDSDNIIENSSEDYFEESCLDSVYIGFEVEED